MATKTIQVSPADIDLFHVAAAEWGDASAWLALATANGMVDPVIYGLQSLVVPEYQASFEGSLPAS
ncbi:hypothetical protein ACELLULO517_15800 [Acidisoma cellulosilytica]|uniref:Uncharacterized protein n=1 Tax=Acidisoma cellulosilyticum TaxID=2802395 RepID=A0A963Z4E0_9PROT|nr:hypothetical protein [Acidisoma cellulosilyticum]MCB8881712.1 hypothetical protein [Acidisoma cellulosilyticum]